MTVLECGTSVKTKIGGKVGMITCAAIRFDAIMYEVTYYEDKEFQAVWMREQELVIDDRKERKIGFKK